MTISELQKSLQFLLDSGASSNTDILVHDASGDALIAEETFIAGGKVWIV